MNSAEDDQDGKYAGALALQRETEGTGIVQSTREKVLGRLNSILALDRMSLSTKESQALSQCYVVEDKRHKV